MKFLELYNVLCERKLTDIYDKIMYAHEYKSPKHYDLNDEERHIRNVAYSIKKLNSPYMDEAGKDMSKFVNQNDILVPIPSSKGDTSVNLQLSNKIAKYSKSKVLDLLGTEVERDSNLVRSKMGLPRLTAKDMKLILKQHIKDNRNIVFIDNVSTTGSSIHGAMNLINGGRGLVYAKDLSSSIKF